MAWAAGVVEAQATASAVEELAAGATRGGAGVAGGGRGGGWRRSWGRWSAGGGRRGEAGRRPVVAALEEALAAPWRGAEREERTRWVISI
jgi:hypothetical protein